MKRQLTKAQIAKIAAATNKAWIDRFGSGGRAEGRILNILDKLKTLWSHNRDIRFGQLLINAQLGQSFYEEDDLTEAKLDALIANLPKTP